MVTRVEDGQCVDAQGNKAKGGQIAIGGGLNQTACFAQCDADPLLKACEFYELSKTPFCYVYYNNIARVDGKGLNNKAKCYLKGKRRRVNIINAHRHCE